MQLARQATPTYVLGNAYVSYIRLNRCEQEREGYAAVYISEAEMERAKTAVKRLEDKLTRGGLIMNPDEGGSTWTTKLMWNEANKFVSRDPVRRGDEYRNACQQIFRSFMDAHRKQVPEDDRIQKDF
jgi:hypothetical protein